MAAAFRPTGRQLRPLHVMRGAAPHWLAGDHVRREEPAAVCAEREGTAPPGVGRGRRTNVAPMTSPPRGDTAHDVITAAMTSPRHKIRPRSRALRGSRGHSKRALLSATEPSIPSRRAMAGGGRARSASSISQRAPNRRRAEHNFSPPLQGSGNGDTVMRSAHLSRQGLQVFPFRTQSRLQNPTGKGEIHPIEGKISREEDSSEIPAAGGAVTMAVCSAVRADGALQAEKLRRALKLGETECGLGKIKAALHPNGASS
ncbi:uncharacterized protein LOC112530471 isoform X1 [Gallus gallus]|uniref:uncharacterized protein LOC112530471 isoform X1 n=1 Tax=Gallus gallus TaxID=9031 RepID=UPI001AE29107|nr:uncharacterized protein LOC112530471 isoform X1 [Gallus gallus]